MQELEKTTEENPWNGKTGKVYLITSPSGRKYVGSTYREVEERWREYPTKKCLKEQPRVGRSIKKYGWDAHTKEVIWEGPVDLMFRMEHLSGLEHNVLDKHKGMNCNLPGYDNIPGLIGEETREKMSKSQKGKKKNMTEEGRQAIIHLNKNRTYTDEQRKRRSEISKNRPPITDETRAKMSKARIGKKMSPEAIAKTAAFWTGRKHSEEAKKKMSESQRQ